RVRADPDLAGTSNLTTERQRWLHNHPSDATIAPIMTDALSPSQAAARIGATTRSVQRWIAAGRLPASRVGARWRVASDALDAFVANGARPAGAAPSATAPGEIAIRRLFVANRGEIAA